MALGGGAGASTSNSLPTSVNPISSGRLLLKRPSSQKLEEDEIKRNSIDALHGLTLG